jgi:hypothetical protein
VLALFQKSKSRITKAMYRADRLQPCETRGGIRCIARIVARAHADTGYITNDWKDNPNGEDYFSELGGKGSPDLQRAAKELLATYGPKIGEFEDTFAAKHGWT